ncbi:MAG TPA: hypothetical protein VGO33_14920 [Gemmatimonadaceae bacterium]|nr:hypothetical protein [Gemmatimonadaceae bacterium]
MLTIKIYNAGVGVELRFELLGHSNVPLRGSMLRAVWTFRLAVL